MASVSRIMRASMLGEVVQQDYIKTARSKGISKFRVTWKHQIRNAIMPRSCHDPRSDGSSRSDRHIRY